jgi:response regulator RpfG family c-di-GMP phosphodiesterase
MRLTAEKQLLEETLKNSLQVMAEILDVVNTTAFSRSSRVKKLAGNLAARCGITDIWQIEIAAMLSQIGCVAVPETILQKIASGRSLVGAELNLYQQHPQIGHDLIAKIPRMAAVAEMILNQNRRFDDEIEGSGDVRKGARILKVALDFDKLLEQHELPHQAFKDLISRAGWYDPAVLEGLKNFIDTASQQLVSMTIPVYKAQPGMLLDDAIYSSSGVLLLSRGQEITGPLMVRLVNLADTKMIDEVIKVKVAVNAFKLAELAESQTVIDEPEYV